jgi:hypothetical protein
MYTKPQLAYFGTFRDLTRAGCQGALDGRVVEGVGTSTGSEFNATADFCFVNSR